jgi:hypothetical protein
VLLSVILKGQNIQGERVEQVISRIDENTEKIERYSEQIARMVKLIEEEEKVEIKDIEKKN